VRRSIAIAFSALLALLMAAPTAFGQVADDSVASEQARELSAVWWQWALEKPTATSPLNGSYKGGPQCNGQGASGSAKTVWFLAGTITGEKVERTCTVPAGREIFFPVFNLIDLNVEGAQTEEELRQEVKGWTDDALANPSPPLFATVDGEPVEMNRLNSPSALFHFTLLERNYVTETFGIPSGPYVGVTDGVWVALPPLSKGSHTIHFGGNGQDSTYNLKVE
jgi:hypothetical protein